MDTLLSIEGLTVEVRSRRDTVTPVAGIDFDIARGETVGLVGESGSGKSLTAMSIIRLLPTRAVQMTKQIVTTLKMMPIPEAVSIPFFAKQIDQATNTFVGNPGLETSAQAMLTELARWAAALKPLRG